jgi:branched-chain amino acid transport system ATP-binding protein
MVEQNAYAALEMCDYAYLIEVGAISLQGTGDKLINDPHVRRAYLGAGAAQA